MGSPVPACLACSACPRDQTLCLETETLGPKHAQAHSSPTMQNLEGAVGGKVYQFCKMGRKKKCKKECHLLQRLSDYPTSARLL